jgi:hypothetical protein
VVHTVEQDQLDAVWQTKAGFVAQRELDARSAKTKTELTNN